MMRDTIILLCNCTNYLAAPFLARGYKVQMVDPVLTWTTQEGNIHKIAMTVLEAIQSGILNTGRAAGVYSMPVCTDVAVSGALHWENKRAVDPYFQAKASLLAEQCRMIGIMSGCPWWFENPVSAFASIFGPSSYSFDPSDYGGYLPKDDVHPDFPEDIAPRDAYPKETHLWAGGGFVMPPKKPVFCRDGYSDQYKKLGGKSAKTKMIRSATPRGFAIAVAEYNAPVLEAEKQRIAA